jgi:hypothetical protein
MLIPLGILGASGAGIPIPDYELISSTILTGNTTEVSLSGLGTYSADYKHLQIRMTAKNSGTWDSPALRFNGATSDYHNHHLRGDSSTVSANHRLGSTEFLWQGLQAKNAATSVYSAVVIDILDIFSTSKNKTLRLLGGKHEGGSDNFIVLGMGFRNNTGSLSSIQVRSFIGNFVAGSRFSIYGIKG